MNEAKAQKTYKAAHEDCHRGDEQTKPSGKVQEIINLRRDSIDEHSDSSDYDTYGIGKNYSVKEKKFSSESKIPEIMIGRVECGYELLYSSKKKVRSPTSVMIKAQSTQAATTEPYPNCTKSSFDKTTNWGSGNLTVATVAGTASIQSERKNSKENLLHTSRRISFKSDKEPSLQSLSHFVKEKAQLRKSIVPEKPSSNQNLDHPPEGNTPVTLPKQVKAPSLRTILSQGTSKESLKSQEQSEDDDDDEDEDFEEEVEEEIIEEEDSVSENDDSGHESEDKASFISRIRAQIVKRSSKSIPEEYHHLFETEDEKSDFKANKSKYLSSPITIKRTITFRKKLKRSQTSLIDDSTGSGQFYQFQHVEKEPLELKSFGDSNRQLKRSQSVVHQRPVTSSEQRSGKTFDNNFDKELPSQLTTAKVVDKKILNTLSKEEDIQTIGQGKYSLAQSTIKEDSNEYQSSGIQSAQQRQNSMKVPRLGSFNSKSSYDPNSSEAAFTFQAPTTRNSQKRETLGSFQTQKFPSIQQSGSENNGTNKLVTQIEQKIQSSPSQNDAGIAIVSSSEDLAQKPNKGFASDQVSQSPNNASLLKTPGLGISSHRTSNKNDFQTKSGREFPYLKRKPVPDFLKNIENSTKLNKAQPIIPRAVVPKKTNLVQLSQRGNGLAKQQNLGRKSQVNRSVETQAEGDQLLPSIVTGARNLLDKGVSKSQERIGEMLVTNIQMINQLDKHHGNHYSAKSKFGATKHIHQRNNFIRGLSPMQAVTIVQDHSQYESPNAIAVDSPQFYDYLGQQLQEEMVESKKSKQKVTQQDCSDVLEIISNSYKSLQKLEELSVAFSARVTKNLKNRQ